jgi:hypothetical protein
MTRKRVTLMAVPATILGLAGAAAATPGRTVHTAGSPAAQVRTAERTLLSAAVGADTQTAGTLLAHDFQLIDVTGAPETRADYLATIGGKIFVRLEPAAPISVRVHGSSAVARVKLHFKVVAGGAHARTRRMDHGRLRTASRSLAGGVVAVDRHPEQRRPLR